MAERRNSYTAILFLAALAAGVVFLLLGVLPAPGGFTAAERSGPRPVAETVGKRPAPAEEIEEATETGEVPETEELSVALRDWAHRKEGREVPARRTAAETLRNRAGLGAVLAQADGAVTAYIDGADQGLNELLDRDHAFIELYGGVQRAMGRRVVEDPDPQYTVVKLTDELFGFANLDARQVDMTRRAIEMTNFARWVKEETKVPMLYVQAPSKLDVAELPEGLTDYSDAEADQFLALLKRGGVVDTLDLRPVYRAAAQEDPEAAQALFFRTDHHWTPAGAFLGFQTLCEKLEGRPYRFAIDQETTEPDNYETYTFEEVFLGSQGRRVGSLYTGLDQVEIWSPKFPTSINYSVPILGIEREGTFVTSLLFPERLTETDLYEANPYTIYSGGDYILARGVNLNDPDGKRVLVLRDSFGCALTPFLTLTCGEVMTIDPRSFNGDHNTMMTFINWLKPDLIIVLNAPSSLRVDKLFPYLPTARGAYLKARQAGLES